MKKLLISIIVLTFSASFASALEVKCLENPLNICETSMNGNGNTANPVKVGANTTGHKPANAPDRPNPGTNRTGHATTTN